ncbi:MAG: peptidoglycan-binding protein, partial [Bosea sp. (in: a-proteobacteria)]
SKGLSPDRIAATGFGEFQPLDAATNDDAYRRNRRIEFKITER